MPKKIIFTGAGCNDSSLLTAIANAIHSPSKDTLPAGATWPFVTLSINKQSVEFRMMHIRKVAMPSDTEISLSKLGYLYFRTPNHLNDFGFATLKIYTLLKELRECGYSLDESCIRNVFVARAVLLVMLAVPVVVFAFVIVMTILKPNGV